MLPVVSSSVGSGLSINQQCTLLGIARSSYYWHRSRRIPVLAGEQEMVLRNRIQTICLEWPCYGYRRVRHQLQREGYCVNHKRVKRLMKEDNLLCLRRKAFVPATTNSCHGQRIYPNLTKGIELIELNQLWIADITYIRLQKEFIYLAVILDAFSRRVIGWALDRYIQTHLALEALRMALRGREISSGLIHHSDRGVQYASGEYIEQLTLAGVAISMSRKGNPYDNAKAEAFMSTLKKEEVHMNEYESFEQARQNIRRFLESYNNLRLHSSLGYYAPAVFENNHKQSQLCSTLTTVFAVQE
jgi:transposase InsO family protein